MRRTRVLGSRTPGTVGVDEGRTEGVGGGWYGKTMTSQSGGRSAETRPAGWQGGMKMGMVSFL